MNKWTKDITNLMTKFGHEIKTKPGHIDEKAMTLRYKLIEEEAEELLEALRDKHPLVDLSKEIVDVLVVTIGCAVSFGLTDVLDDIWDLVQESNLAKVGGPVDPDTGKILKPEGWVNPKPKIKELLFGPELKVCPFCDSEQMSVRNLVRMHHIDYWVQCDNCLSKSGSYPNAPEAIEQWNSRIKPGIIFDHSIINAPIIFDLSKLDQKCMKCNGTGFMVDTSVRCTGLDPRQPNTRHTNCTSCGGEGRIQFNCAPPEIYGDCIPQCTNCFKHSGSCLCKKPQWSVEYSKIQKLKKIHDANRRSEADQKTINELMDDKWDLTP